ncbi:hypothetical protein [Reichenbachiella ulvae]|uniref:SpoIIAA-like n=1 Tax=Reichenbachiella ulvae TaxID=2980104 RepID=A0ABT3CN97_9BACT|nr:hypothetical protein [Reichenbachiella ulvae]MCV9385064.1 hypothetical protein [Reichenbachiella ulvae]
MAGYELIRHQGKEILIVDYTDMSKEDILKTMEEATAYALDLNRPLLRLSNMTGVFAVKEVLEKAKESGKVTSHLTIKRAAVGITGAKKVLFNAYNRFTGNHSRAFDSVEEAKDWLVS